MSVTHGAFKCQIPVPSVLHPRAIRAPSGNLNLAEHQFGSRGRKGPGPACARPRAPIWCSATFGFADGTRLVRRWCAHGTQMDHGLNKIAIFFDHWRSRHFHSKNRNPLIEEKEKTSKHPTRKLPNTYIRDIQRYTI